MNTETNNTGTTQNVVITNETQTTKRGRGRPINEKLQRRVYLTDDFKVRGKGAPPVGKEVKYCLIQRNIKSKDFIFNPEKMTVLTEVSKARVYTKKAINTTIVASPILVETASSEVPSTHVSVAGTVVQNNDSIVVDQSVAA